MPRSEPLQSHALEVVQEHMNDSGLPPEAHASVRQHYENLTRLTQNLKGLGMDQQQIDDHVLHIFREYERKLAANIERIRTTGDETRR